MATKYSYKISTDFSGNFNNYQFKTEIEADAGITPTCDYIETDADDVDVWFDSSLSGAEQTTLDNLVSAHTPHVEIGSGTYGESNSLSTTTSTSYVQKYKLSLTNIPSGDYYIKWSASVGNTIKNKGSIVRIQLDDTTTLAENGFTLYTDSIPSVPFCGFKKETLNSGNHDIDIDYKTTSDGGSAEISDVRIWVTNS